MFVFSDWSHGGPSGTDEQLVKDADQRRNQNREALRPGACEEIPAPDGEGIATPTRGEGYCNTFGEGSTRKAAVRQTCPGGIARSAGCYHTNTWQSMKGHHLIHLGTGDAGSYRQTNTWAQGWCLPARLILRSVSPGGVGSAAPHPGRRRGGGPARPF